MQTDDSAVLYDWVELHIFFSISSISLSLAGSLLLFTGESIVVEVKFSQVHVELWSNLQEQVELDSNVFKHETLEDTF